MRGINKELIINSYLRAQSGALSEGDCDDPHKNEDNSSHIDMMNDEQIIDGFENPVSSQETGQLGN
jgi:hypothetical protein